MHGRTVRASSVDRKKEEGKLFTLLKLAEFFSFLCFQLALQAAWALPFHSSFAFLYSIPSFLAFLSFFRWHIIQPFFQVIEFISNFVTMLQEYFDFVLLFCKYLQRFHSNLSIFVEIRAS